MYGFNNPGGFDPMSYWNPQRMQQAQGYGMYDGGYQPQAPQGADQGNARIDKLKGRIGNLQQQWAGADSGAQAGIQARIDKMQGRVKNLRQDRRQGEGLYAPQAGQQQSAIGGGFGGMGGYGGAGMGGAGWGGGMSPWGNMGGGYGMGGSGYGMGGGYGNRGGWDAGMGPQMGGGYNPMAGQQQNMGGPAPTGANRPGMQYRQDRRQARQNGAPQAAQAPNAGGGPQSFYLPSTFQTQFGDLVQSSTGQNNVYKRNGEDDNMLFHYDPTQGWKTMTGDAYASYGDYNYADPNQYAAQAGGRRQDWQQKNGFWQGVGGTYA